MQNLWYNYAYMHKAFYASGFLFHPPTQQILLQQQLNTSPALWSLVGGIHLVEESAEKAFQRIVQQFLKHKLPIKNIYPIYTYDREESEKNKAILYADIEEMIEFKPTKDFAFGWFTRKQIMKLPLDPQTKQDIVVGHRVIDAKTRKSLGEHTLE